MRLKIIQKINPKERNFINYALLPFSIIFIILSFIRRILYQTNILKIYKAKIPVIVVGNITVGGTGKTPVVIEIVKYLQKKGYKIGVVSRGYGRDNNNLVIVQANSKALQCGDEPLLIFQQTKALVAISSNRVEAIKAIENQVDIIISDDGLQHYKFKRDIEIIVFSGFDNGFYLPAGGLREGRSRLRNADLVLTPNQRILQNLKFINAKTKKEYALDFFQNQEVLAICGIANPQRFFDNLRSLRIVVEEKTFPDHYNFIKNDLISNKPVITTAKDWVKYKDFASDNIWFLEIKIQIDTDFYLKLDEKLDEKL